jgi:hypothetical protein
MHRQLETRGNAPRGGFLWPGAVLAVAAVTLAGNAAAQFAINAHVIAGGGGTIRSAGGCREVTSIFGEPGGGRMTGGAFALDAGFQAGPGKVRSDRMFHGDFEVCS